jgi:uncharacterized protein YcbX
MREPHPLGTLERLWRYPIKSLRPEVLERAVLNEDGLEGDRRSALFVRTATHARAGKPYRGKEHNLLHTIDDPAVAARLAAERGLEIERRDDGPHFDAGTVSIVLNTWVADLERSLGFPLDPQRYRPNLFVRAAAGFTLDEAALVGATLVVGSVELLVTEPINRCVTTSYDVETGVPNPEVLRAVAQERDNVMGVYCAVTRPGTIALGDRIFISSEEDPR